LKSIIVVREKEQISWETDPKKLSRSQHREIEGVKCEINVKKYRD
jgi:hypothetical protein